MIHQPLRSFQRRKQGHNRGSLLARDGAGSSKTDENGVIVLNMKRRKWILKRYLKKNDD